jgi:adenosylmethionine-8-amino-7-oxononanoate aminotransferase
MLWGVEFLADRKTKAPLPSEYHFSRRVADLAFARGVIFDPGSGSVDGIRGDHLLIAPPLVITEAEIDEMIGVLKGVILDAWEDV